MLNCSDLTPFHLQILNLLTSQELKVVMPYSGIIPRTYVLQPGMVMFLGALGRIDFLKVTSIEISIKQ